MTDGGWRMTVIHHLSSAISLKRGSIKKIAPLLTGLFKSGNQICLHIIVILLRLFRCRSLNNYNFFYHYRYWFVSFHCHRLYNRLWFWCCRFFCRWFFRRRFLFSNCLLFRCGFFGCFLLCCFFGSAFYSFFSCFFADNLLSCFLFLRGWSAAFFSGRFFLCRCFLSCFPAWLCFRFLFGGHTTRFCS